MRRMLLTALMTLAWLLASPSLQFPDSGWLEVGAPPATAEEFRGIMVEEPARASRPAKKTSVKKTSAKKTSAKTTSGEKTAIPARVGARVRSGGLVTSNQPGFHPMQRIEPPLVATTGTRTVVTPDRDPRYPNVPTVSVLPRGSTGGAARENSQDRIARCTHQGALGGLTPGQQGAYIHNCAF